MFSPTVNTPNIRRHRRHSLRGRVALAWTDPHGVTRTLTGSAIDVSTCGMSIELKEPIDPMTYAGLRMERPPLAGTGSIRYCTRKQLNWVLGIEFCGGLEWRPPLSEPPY